MKPAPRTPWIPAVDDAPLTLHVTPDGDDSECSASSPGSIGQAQERIRSTRESRGGDAAVLLHDGVYRLDSPLEFRPDDGGAPDSTVTWAAADGAHPIVTGSIAVSGWRLHDADANVFVAETPIGLDTRQLFVEGVFAPKASIGLPLDAIEFTAEGITLLDPALSFLAGLPQQHRIEFESMGDFTNRYSPVESITGDRIVMAQPAWANNTWGWDTPQAPLLGAPTFFLSNSLGFLDAVGEWFIDPEAGALYYKPGDGVDPNDLDIELPRLETLVSIGGTYDEPVTGLAFRGLQFSGTSWLEPSTEGYVTQQNGSYIKDVYVDRPIDAFETCKRGCPEFERTRTSWYQQPAAVQVSAASRIAFIGNTFTGLGQSALGIGNDANATMTGTGLGARSIEVHANVFMEVGGHGIVVGGNRPDAHHPSDERMTNADIRVENNTVRRAAVEYKDHSGILSTYVSGLEVLHNEVADVPYDAIDTGYGWGMNDAGGSPEYADRGYYERNPRYDTPTTLRDNRVAGNLVHDAKARFHDGGSIYNLAASPGSVIEENHLYNVSGVGLYLDEGTRFATYRRNVLDGADPWVFTNSYGQRQTTKDDLITGNWYDGGETKTPNAEEHDIRVEGNVEVADREWPGAALDVIRSAGVAPEYRTRLNANVLVADDGAGDTGAAVGAPFRTTGASVSRSSFRRAGEVFGIEGRGADVGGEGERGLDEYGAVFRPGAVGRQGSVSARVDTINDAHPWAKTGVMIRNDIAAPGASVGYALVAVTSRNGVVFQWDADGDGIVESSVQAAVDTFRPVWVKLVRSGDRVSGQYSVDGVNFARVGSAVLAGAAEVQDGGIFSTSHDPHRSAVNIVSDVRIG